MDSTKPKYPELTFTFTFIADKNTKQHALLMKALHVHLQIQTSHHIGNILDEKKLKLLSKLEDLKRRLILFHMKVKSVDLQLVAGFGNKSTLVTFKRHFRGKLFKKCVDMLLNPDFVLVVVA